MHASTPMDSRGRVGHVLASPALPSEMNGWQGSDMLARSRAAKAQSCCSKGPGPRAAGLKAIEDFFEEGGGRGLQHPWTLTYLHPIGLLLLLAHEPGLVDAGGRHARQLRHPPPDVLALRVIVLQCRQGAGQRERGEGQEGVGKTLRFAPGLSYLIPLC